MLARARMLVPMNTLSMERRAAILAALDNFCRSHQTLTRANRGVHLTPAMAGGVTNHRWTLQEVLALAYPVALAA